ncbi:MAG: type III secretion system stalk subunit SctO [bacterium]
MSQRKQQNLQQLLEIRQRRKEQIQIAIRRARLAIRHAEEQYAVQQQAFIDHQQHRTQQESHLFQQLSQQTFSAQNYADYTLIVEQLKHQDNSFEENIQHAKTAITQAESHYQTIQQQHIAITQAIDKLKKALEKNKKTLQQQQQTQEDNELDELAQAMFLQRAS